MSLCRTALPLLATMSILLCGTPSANEIIECGPDAISADASVWQQNSSTNYGSATFLAVGPESGLPWRFYVSFDLENCLPPDAEIVTATLTMQPIQANDASDWTIQVYRGASSWTENGLTWANQPGATGSVLDSDICSGTEDLVSFDVTAAIQEWWINPPSNNGLMVRGSTETGSTAYFFPSRENASWDARKPQLTVEIESDLAVCCDPTTEECYILSETDCNLAGWEYHPEWTSCDPNPCDPPDVLTVCPDGSEQYTNIQAAISAAPEGAIIELCEGVPFVGTGNRDLSFQGKAITVRSVSGDAENCVIDCEGEGRGFSFAHGEQANSRLESVTIQNGHASTGGAIYLAAAVSPTLYNCWFVTNTSVAGGGAIWCDNASAPTIDKCTFDTNVAGASGGALNCHLGTPSIIGCTLVGNSATDFGSGIYIYGVDLNVDNCIVAFNEGVGVSCAYGGTATLACCDVFGNTGGDWVGCLEGQEGISGNISADPLFCTEPDYRFRLTGASPCSDNANPECGLIGSQEVGCGPDHSIQSILDIGNDQGRFVRVRWNRHPDDSYNSQTPVSKYTLWRRVDELRAPSGEPHTSTGGNVSYPPGEWDFIAELPACGEEQYGIVSPTLCDSTQTGGICWSVFFVRAHTESQYLYYDCPPDSGYSVDNLVPGPPDNVHWEIPDQLMVWAESEAEDFDYFTVFGSESYVFNGLESAPLGSTSDTFMDVTGFDPYPYYHVTATDFSGNRGPAAPLTTSSAVLSQEGVQDAAQITALEPNPAFSRVHIAFELPSRGRARVTVLDVGGRLVRELANREFEAGEHCLEWGGLQSDSRALAQGIYWVRIETPLSSDSRRLTILR